MREQMKKLNTIFISLLFGAGVVAYISVVSGANVNSKYFFGMIALVPILYFALITYKKINRIKVILQLKEEWGKLKTKKRNLQAIEELFRYFENTDSAFHIDDQTWDDLNMKEIYSLIDRTISTPGEQVLYKILRTPLMDDESIITRKQIVKFFQENEKVREDIQGYLSDLGRQRENLVTSFLWEKTFTPFKHKYVFNLLALLAIFSVISIFFMGFKGFLLIGVPVFMINTMVHYKVKGIISGQFPTIDYVGRMVRTAYNISQYKNENSGLKLDELEKSAKACKGILKKRLISQNAPVSDLEFIYEYINIFLLMDERNFFNSIDEINLRKEDLKNIFLILGEADALISIASYREGLQSYCEPKLAKGGAKIQGINMRHPLLEEGVPNSFSAQGQGAVITGSNMSGKSTFLRALGINTLFAQTICTCIAYEFSAGYMKVMSSISQGDNLVGGKSYYLAEAESLLRIIKAVEDNIPALCIIDEIFRGTNPIERVNASVEILKYLINHNTIVVVATHDLEITEMIKDSYNFYYFSEDIGDEGLKFDYKIKSGISKNRNAVKLMKYLGYPDDIIVRTMNRVAGLE